MKYQQMRYIMLTVGDKFPNFSLKAATTLEHPNVPFPVISKDTYRGKWLTVFFWPKDFTFVCPTEIEEFGRLNKDFAKRNAQVLGVSTDSEFVHHAWRTHHKNLRELPFPMLADVKRELSETLGILDKNEGVALRATFIVDPDEIIRFASVHDLSTGRNVEEVLRTLDALQTGELCPCNWQPGDKVIKVG